MNLKDFVMHCMSDDEFWNRGGIPTNEKQFIESLNINEEQLSKFYSAMLDLRDIYKELN